MFKRKCYIAQYPKNLAGNDLDEIILKQDTYWSNEISVFWYELIANRKPSEPMLQAWYSDENDVRCLATTNQPFKLD